MAYVSSHYLRLIIIGLVILPTLSCVFIARMLSYKTKRTKIFDKFACTNNHWLSAKLSDLIIRKGTAKINKSFTSYTIFNKQ